MILYAVKNTINGHYLTGTSDAPKFFTSKGKAEGCRKTTCYEHVIGEDGRIMRNGRKAVTRPLANWIVVEVELNEVQSAEG